MNGPRPVLPLSPEELPESVARFVATTSPVPMRAMAAKGLVPVKGTDLVVVLVQLTVDPDAGVASAATESVAKLPDPIVFAAAEAPLHAAVLAELARVFRTNEGVLERIVSNASASDYTIEDVARDCSERVTELIAINQQRLLRAPIIIEALYANRATRMSTVDRMVELAARNGVRLNGIPAFDAHVEAISGQLIFEPSEEPAPDDVLFQRAVEKDDEKAAVEIDPKNGEERVKPGMKPLHQLIREMTLPHKIRFAILGNGAARALLVRDNNKQVALATIASPRMTDAEAAEIARSKEVCVEVLRYIGNRREWMSNYELKRNLLFNPKTPMAISLTLVNHMRMADIKELTRSRNVTPAIKSAALQRLAKMEKRG